MTLEDIVNKMEGTKVAVFGDLMLDEFNYGTVERISPEAPIPVVHIQFRERYPGGCGNAATNMAALGVETAVFSVVGKDLQADIISKLLEEKGVKTELVNDATRPTIRKSRIIAHNQQVVRVDTEKTHEIPKELEKEILDRVKTLEDFDIIVLSDYAKGFLTQNLCSKLIDLAKEAGKPILADPKTHFAKYKNVSAITPNLKELIEYGHVETTKNPNHLLAAGTKITQDTSISRILVTLGEDGMAMLERGKCTKVPALSKGKAVDVAGAGDVVIGAYAAALAAGSSHVDAMKISNYAASIGVTKVGTCICSQEELRQAIQNQKMEEVVAC